MHPDTCSFVAIPFQLDTNKLCGFLVHFQLTVLLHSLHEVVQVLNIVELHSKVINCEHKADVAGLALEATF